MKISTAIAIARNPNIQIYESLTELLGLIADMGYRLEIICPVRTYEDEPLWKPAEVNYSFVQPKNKKMGIPTTFKLFAHALFESIKKPPNLLIGLDSIGNIVAAFIHRLQGIPFIYYGLELPCLNQPGMTWVERMEHWSIRTADMVVTMDDHHATFICAQTGISKERCVYLPNAISGKALPVSRDLLRKQFGLKESDIVVLHAGGIGAAQKSIDMARCARHWPAGMHMVFHVHCRMNHEHYFQEFLKELNSSETVHLSIKPLPTEQLDGLVGCADIGIAWYDRDLLGFRAELLGLAAGKIGRYLRNGVPVIVQNLPSIKYYIERYDCGICMDLLEDVDHAISRIMGDHERYSRNARRCYESLWRPEIYLPEIKRRIEALS